MNDREKINTKKAVLFQAVQCGNIQLIHDLLDQGLDINTQDQAGNTLLHHAAKRGYSHLVGYLLERQANVFIKNKRGYTALLEGYTTNYNNITNKITTSIIEKSSVKAVLQSFPTKKFDLNEQIKVKHFIQECKDHIRKSYLNRNVCSRLLARHNERAKALIQALDHCGSIREVKILFKNQNDLFKTGKASKFISPDLLAPRWSGTLKNKPANPLKSNFYKVLNTMPEPNFGLLVQKNQSSRPIY